MVKEKETIIFHTNRIIDLFLTLGAFFIAYFIRTQLLTDYFKILKFTSDYKLVGFLIISIWYLVFEKFKIFSLYKEYSLRKVFLEVLKAISIGMLFLILCMYLFSITTMSRLVIGIFYFLDIVLIFANKIIIHRIQYYIHSSDFNIRRILIVGSKTRAKTNIEKILKQKATNVLILGCLEIDNVEIGKKVAHDVTVIDTVDNLESILLTKVVDELIFAMPLTNITKINEYVQLACVMGISLHIIPDFQIHHVINTVKFGTLKFEDFNGVLTMSIHTTPVNYNMLFIKSAFDYIIAAVILVTFLPILITIFIAIKLISPGPAFFKQERCGLNGRKFTLYKFRTMVVKAEDLKEELKGMNEAEEPVFKLKKDPRIIPFIGTILRRTGLDETPQLINVLKGEMSLVGPRPPLPNEVKKYKLSQRRRLSMKPGLTCLWQIKPKRNETNFQEWINMDLKYIDNWSLLMDFKILSATIRTILMAGGR